MPGPMTTLALARSAVCGTCIAAALGVGVPAAHAWTSPEAISVNADAKAFAVAGDPAGNAFAVVAGGTLDEPLLLVERTAVTQFTPKSIFTWGAPQPFPGGAPKWTVPGAQVGAVGAAASGIGAGVIAVREDRKGGSLVRALVRDPGGPFTDPVTILGAPYNPMTRPALGVAEGGLAVVAVGATGPHRARRVAIVTRMPGGNFRRPRFFASKSLGTPSVTAGAGTGAPVVAWVSGDRALASRIDGDGNVGRPQFLGTARRGAPIAVASGRGGRGVVVWEGADGRIRVARRSGPGRLSPSLGIGNASADRTRDIAAAIDDFGRAFVVWRAGTGAGIHIVVAQGTAGVASLRLTTLAEGTGIGAPVMTGRPGGGAAIAWAAPKGWQAAKAAKDGVFGTTATVSAPLKAGDVPLGPGSALAGPGTRVDLIWRQHGDAAPTDGIDVLQSQDDS